MTAPSGDSPTSQSITERYLANNRAFASNGFVVPEKRGPRVAVVACMDARMNVYAILGAAEGEAHVIRNAGGVLSEDALRSLIVSQHMLGTREIILIHHTECGMLTFTDDQLRERVAATTGTAPAIAFHAFGDLEDDVRAGMRQIRESPFLISHEVRGFVYNLSNGLLEEVFER